jgi:hypothetical protein
MSTGAAWAQTDDVSQYAIVVGANVGGPGQPELKYAEQDARRMADVLTELSGYAARNVVQLTRPTPAQVTSAIENVRARIVADQMAGKVSRLLFYYSGHAKASGLNLGDDEFPLEELRAKLLSLPSKLTVVILDACQSGAFSRVKGANAAADFSINSKSRLDATGIAVLASSTGTELSQESETLQASYFTHHLLVGMRGAADSNHDGRVSVDEGYRYAYNQTLLATAQTAVGGQHVTLEVDLKGHGEIPLSFPQPATAKIELPVTLVGKTTIEHLRSRSIIAEIEKVAGAPIRVAVAPGGYRIVVRGRDGIRRCNVTAAANIVATIDENACELIAPEVTARKGGADPSNRIDKPTMIMVGFEVGGERDDAFIATLRNFQYKSGEDNNNAGLTAGLVAMALRRIHPNVAVGGSIEYHNSATWTRRTELSPLTFQWNTGAISALGLVDTPLSTSARGRSIRPYVLGGAGLGIGRTHFRDAYEVATTENHAGIAFTVGAGVQFLGYQQPGSIAGGMSVNLGYRFNYAPIVSNLVGETHSSGGHRFELTVGYRF